MRGETQMYVNVWIALTSLSELSEGDGNAWNSIGT